MKRKRRSWVEAVISAVTRWSRATVKSSFRRAFTHPSPQQHVRIRASMRLLWMQTPKDVEPRGYRDVTTSLTAASREDGPFLTGSFVAAITPRNCDGVRRWHFVPDRKIRTRTSTSRCIERIVGATFLTIRRNISNLSWLYYDTRDLAETNSAQSIFLVTARVARSTSVPLSDSFQKQGHSRFTEVEQSTLAFVIE